MLEGNPECRMPILRSIQCRIILSSTINLDVPIKKIKWFSSSTTAYRCPLFLLKLLEKLLVWGGHTYKKNKNNIKNRKSPQGLRVMTGLKNSTSRPIVLTHNPII